MTDDSKPKEDELSHDEDQEVVDSAPKSTTKSERAHASDDGGDDDADDDEHVPAPKSAKPKTGVKHKKGKKSRPPLAKASTSVPSSASGASAGLLVAAALVAGAAAGWFANEARGKAPDPQVQAATAGGQTPCAAWGKQVCEGAGDKSSACTQAKEVAELLPEAACSAALTDVAATLAKVKAARADCNKLVSKLCTDLGKDTGTCKMVTERTESFPTDRCKEMMGNYEKVLGQLKAMEERGGPGANPHGASPGGPGGPGAGMPRMPGGPPGSPAGLPPGAIRLGGTPKASSPTAPAPKAPAPAPAPKPAQ